MSARRKMRAVRAAAGCWPGFVSLLFGMEVRDSVYEAPSRQTSTSPGGSCQGHPSAGAGRETQAAPGTQSIFYKKLVTNHPVHANNRPFPSHPGWSGVQQQSLACNKEGSIGIVSNPQIQIFSLLAGTGSFLFSNQKDSV